MGNRWWARIALVAVTVLGFTACQSSASRQAPDRAVAVLLFNGSGTSAGDVAATAAVLNRNHLDYAMVNSSQLNDMSGPQLRAHRLLIVPGGNFVEIGNNLTANTAAKVREAVQGGLNYLGLCAGAFFAGDSPYNGLNLTAGARFPFYSAEERGIRKTAVGIVDADSRILDQYWEDGPQLSGWGAVVAKYPDGTPAIVEGMSGNGWVILSGVHPEAPESWRRGMSFGTPASVDNAYAGTLIQAALSGTWLSHF